MIHLDAGRTRPVCGEYPDSISSLSRWCRWRERLKEYADGKKRTIFEPERLVSLTLTQASSRPWGRPPRNRSMREGYGVWVREEYGLAVIRNANVELAGRLGNAVVHVEQEVEGPGLVVIVRAGVLGSKTNCFVPLSGRRPHQEPMTVCLNANPDGIRTESGQTPHQQNGDSGQPPHQQNGRFPDEARTLYSCTPQDNYQQGCKKSVEDQLADFAQEWITQEAEGRKHWLYSVLTILKANGILKSDQVDAAVLRKFADIIKKDVGEVWRKIISAWDKWKHHEVLLSDAMRAVHADASLLNGLREMVADDKTLLVAGVCRFLGKSGQPFVLDQAVLGKVVGLSRQDACELLQALRELHLLKLHEAARYTQKKSNVYLWVGPGAVPLAPVAKTPAPHPIADPPPPWMSDPTASQVVTRPGCSPQQDAAHPYKSLVYQGGYVEPAHHLAEKVLARKLGQSSLSAGTLSKDKHGGEYARQVNAARTLAENFDYKAIGRALDRPDAKNCYSMAAPWFRSMVEQEQKNVEHTQAVLASNAKEAAVAPPIDILPASRPTFVPKGSVLSAMRRCRA